MNLESFGVDGGGYDETETEPPSSTNAVKIMFQVTQIARFLLEALSAVFVFVTLVFADMV